MAEGNNSAQERTEQATPKRLQDARKKGDVPRSRELVTSGVMLSCAGLLLAISKPVGHKLAAGFAGAFSIERARLLEADFMAASLADQTVAAVQLLIPLLAVSAIAAISSEVQPVTSFARVNADAFE